MDEYETFLTEDDERSRPFRAERLRLLKAEFGEDRHILIPGGWVAATAFEEARLAYLHGLWVAVVLLSQTALEHMLAGLLRMKGHDGRWNFNEILDLALKDHLITDDEFELFDRLRLLRNPYVHARVPFGPKTLDRRVVESDFTSDVRDLMVEDATLAIKALLGMLRREPFTSQP